MTKLDEKVDEIVASGALGRSPVYERLLRYLCEKTDAGSMPKEIDIATDVFERDSFDPANDSTVRVYLHNLRQKLDTYYGALPAGPSLRLQIPKGEYRLELVSADGPDSLPAAGSGRQRYWYAAAVVVVAFIAFLTGRATVPTEVPAAATAASTPVWQAILDDDLPVTVVVGDYFVFAEMDDSGISDRLIRDFSINDSAAFDDYLLANPDLEKRYLDVQLSYLPLGTGAALEAVVRALHRHDKMVRVVPQSQFRAQMIRSAHIIYVGYLSGLGRLARYPFAASRLAVGMSYDELIDTETGVSYLSHAGYVTDDDVGYVDYGYLSTFPGPSDNQFMVVAGMRDEGLMRMAAILTDAGELQSMTSAIAGFRDTAGGPAFETLYEVSSLDRTHVAARRMFAGPLDPGLIWENQAP